MSYCPDIICRTSFGGSVRGNSHVEGGEREGVHRKEEGKAGENLGL